MHPLKEQVFATASNDNEVRFWDIRSESPFLSFKDTQNPTAVRFSSDGGSLFVGGQKGYILKIDMRQVSIEDTLGHEKKKLHRIERIECHTKKRLFDGSNQVKEEKIAHTVDVIAARLKAINQQLHVRQSKARE